MQRRAQHYSDSLKTMDEPPGPPKEVLRRRGTCAWLVWPVAIIVALLLYLVPFLRHMGHGTSRAPQVNDDRPLVEVVFSGDMRTMHACAPTFIRHVVLPNSFLRFEALAFLTVPTREEVSPANELARATLESTHMPLRRLVVESHEFSTAQV